MLYRFSHKTGVYGVSIKEETGNQILVQVEQVIKHPKQGDLHHPNETEGVFFHERKALSHFEKRYIPYEDSLQHAITHLENQLKKEETTYSRLSLNNLNRLKEDYAIQYKRHFD